MVRALSRPLMGRFPVLANSLRYRDVHFAVLFGPPRFVSREEALKVYGQVCTDLKSDEFVFSYGKSEQASRAEVRGFGIEMARPEGKGGFQVRMDYPGMGEPLRLLLGYTWPPSLQSAIEALDLATSAVFEGLGGSWTRVMAEARLRAECAVQGGDAIGFLTSDILGTAGRWIDGLGKPLEFCSTKFEVAPRATSDSLATPKRELTIEVLRDDSSKVYIELMSQWAQLVLTGADEPELRPIDKRPSEYVNAARAFLEGKLRELSPDGGSRS